MKGQWIGRYQGTHDGDEGYLILNVDETPDCFDGVAYVLPDTDSLPRVAAYFQTPNKNNPVTFTTRSIETADPQTLLLTPWNQISHKFPGVVIAQSATVTIEWTQHGASLSWIDNLGISRTASVSASEAHLPSNLVADPTVRDWDSYKLAVSHDIGKDILYRGQNQPWRLRTSYHRTGRANIERYLHQDIQSIHAHLTGRTRHLFDLTDPKQNGAFFGLIQHHGYPTPLLDWTYSPYIAAFFAFRGISKEQAETANPDTMVRIYTFDNALWHQDQPQISQVTYTGLHLSLGKFLAIENDRMIPQQAVSTVTNIDDIEGYLLSTQQESGNIYLRAFDIPIRERARVMRELPFLGITAGALFPGLDGACEELREKNFGW